MQYSQDNYVKTYGQGDSNSAADGYPEWFTSGLEQNSGGQAGDIPDYWPDDGADELAETLPGYPGRGLPDDLPGELPDDWSDYSQDASGHASEGDGRGGSPASAAGAADPLPGADWDDEAFVEFDLAVPVHGLTLRQAVAAVARAVGEKRLELEAWGYHSHGDIYRSRPDRVFRWRFLGYGNGLMRYRAEKAFKS